MIYEKFRNSTDWGFRDQIQRAAISVSSNIAEGYERQRSKEFVRFLIIAKESAGEVKSMIYLAHRIGKLTKDERDHFLECSSEVARLLQGLIRSIHANSGTPTSLVLCPLCTVLCVPPPVYCER